MTDNSGVKRIRIFHVYRWGAKKRGLTGYYFYGAIRKYNQTVNLRRSKKRLWKGQKMHGLLVRSRQFQYRLDGARIRC